VNWMKFPESIKTTRAKIAYTIFRQFYIFDLGRGQAIGRFTTVIPEAGVLLLVLDKLGIFALTKYNIAMAAIIAIVGVYIIGHFYYKWDFDRINIIVGNERNVFLKNIYDVQVKEKETREEL